jgi:S-DNA-T family DNA segregation ATPase FtsK/SpoIIIE
MSLRLTVADRPGAPQPESWIVRVDEATTISEIGESLDVPVDELAPGTDPTSAFTATGSWSACRAAAC